MAESKDVDNEANDVSSRSNLGTTNVKRRVVYGRDADIKRRHASLYDVVDGRFANNVFIDKDPYSTRKNAIRKKGISPDEYFASRRRSRELSQERRKKQEKSIERKSRRSALDAFSKVDSDGGAIDDLERIGLADSDLLKQLHAFTADYYAIQSDAKYMYRMMDGSALMALGTLGPGYMHYGSFI